MSALPRASCPVCSRSVAVRRGGEIREHRGNGPRLCPGSGQVTPESATAAERDNAERDADHDAEREPDDRDEAYERAAARARLDDFADTDGKDWT